MYQNARNLFTCTLHSRLATYNIFVYHRKKKRCHQQIVLHRIIVKELRYHSQATFQESNKVFLEFICYVREIFYQL